MNKKKLIMNLLISFIFLSIVNPFSLFAIDTINEHPRLLFTEGGEGLTVEGLRQRCQEPEYKFRCDWIKSKNQNVVWPALSYVLTDTGSFAITAISRLKTGPSSCSSSCEHAHDLLYYALAYDMVYNYPQFSQSDKNLVERKLADCAVTAINSLDGSCPTLYHGRTAIASQLAVTALVLDHDSRKGFILEKAKEHFRDDAIPAIDYAQGWSEGMTYGAINRFLPFSVAGISWKTATGENIFDLSTEQGEWLKNIGYFMLYGLRPDNTWIRYGDMSSQIEVHNEYRRNIDFIASAYKDPYLANLSQKIFDLVGVVNSSTPGDQDYHYAYNYMWAFPLAYDSSVIPRPLSELPKTKVFGKDSYGLVIMRENWEDDSTYITFKAGDYMAHHGHYDQGHFSIFKNSALAIDSGQYKDYFGARTRYYLRSVAHNTLGIYDPEENMYGGVNDGGQRVVNCCGGNTKSFEDYLDRLTSMHYETGNIEVIESVEDEYDYISADITDAYNNVNFADNDNTGKVSLVTRQFLYLRPETIIIFDRINATSPSFEKRWLLHSITKPVTDSENLVQGGFNAGIMESKDDLFVIENSESRYGNTGKLFAQTLLPKNHTIRKIGGSGYEAWVDGQNRMTYQATDYSNWKKLNEFGRWRVEVVSNNNQNFDNFLHVLKTGDEDKTGVSRGILIDHEQGKGVVVDNQVVIFGKAGLIMDMGYVVDTQGETLHLIFDMEPDTIYDVNIGEDVRQIKTSENGVLKFYDMGTGQRVVSINNGVPVPSCVTHQNKHCACLEYEYGDSIIVNDVTELRSAIEEADEYTNILLMDGVYSTSQLTINTPNLAIRSFSGDRSKVIIDGEYRSGQNLFSVNAQNVTIADMTIKRAYYHPVHVSGGGDNVVLYNLHIIDGREQFVKVNPNTNLLMNDYGLLACSTLELTNQGRNYIQNNPTPGFKCYTGGIDGHKAKGWQVRDNFFKNIYCTNGGLAEHAIHFWSSSRDTLVERNYIENCARGIGFGLGQTGSTRDYYDDPYPDLGYVGHYDGVIKNNIIHVDSGVESYYDTGIGLEQAHGAKVYHNTLVSKPTWSSIDYRFANTYAEVKNNLVYKITQRNSAQGILDSNLERPGNDYFVDAGAGNYMLVSQAVDIIDKGADVGVDFDFDKIRRDSSPDIGAYEFGNVLVDDGNDGNNDSNGDIDDGDDSSDNNTGNIDNGDNGVGIDNGSGGNEDFVSYYVDFSHGSDNNDGLSEASAFKTLSKVNSIDFNHSTYIFFRSGQSWDESLILDDDGVIVSSYGVGDYPSFKGIRLNADNVTVSNFLLDRNKESTDAFIIRDSKDVKIFNCEIRNGVKDGIDMDNVDRINIDNCEVHHFLAGSFFSQNDAHAIVASNTKNLVMNNLNLHHVSGDCFQADPDRDNIVSTNIKITNSILWTSPLETDFNSEWKKGERPGENAVDTKVVKTDYDDVQRLRIQIINVSAYGFEKDSFISNKAVFNMKEKIDAYFENIRVYDSEIGFRIRGSLGNANVVMKNVELFNLDKGIRAEDNLMNLVINDTLFHISVGNYIEIVNGNRNDTWSINNVTYGYVDENLYISSDGDDNGLGTVYDPFKTLSKAVSVVKPGQIIYVESGYYSDSNYFVELVGEVDNPIVIQGMDKNDKPIFTGNSEVMHFTNSRNFILKDLKITGSSANGINIDDGGEYEDINHNIILDGVEFYDIGSNGNQNSLKLSGLNGIVIRNSYIHDGSTGGSGIDMVGCHNVIIEQNYFKNLGSNSIQAKGGSSEILIKDNIFENGGARAINMGGSTGLEFFRPSGVDYEAKNIVVQSNLFIGSQASVAYVGCVNCSVRNNTIKAEKWIFRVLQESVDGFLKVQDGVFEDNLVFYDNKLSNSAFNIGPNTLASTFIVKNNIFVAYDNIIRYLNIPGHDINNKNIKFSDFNLDGSSDFEDYINDEFQMVNDSNNFIGYENLTNESLTNLLNKTQTNLSLDKFNINESVYLIEENGSIRVIGKIGIDNNGEDNFFVVLHDKNRYLIDNLDMVKFNVEPYDVQDDKILFILPKNSSTYFISYEFLTDEETSSLYSAGLGEDIKLNKFKIYEDLNLFNIKGSKFSSFFNYILGYILLGVVILSGYFLFIFRRSVKYEKS